MASRSGSSCSKRQLGCVQRASAPQTRDALAKEPTGHTSCATATVRSQMPRVPLFLLCVLLSIVACSSTNGSSDSGCTGTPPLTCNGCCGAKYAADRCAGGVWTCAPLGVACAMCDAGGADSAVDDASADAMACSGVPPTCTNCCGAPITIECQNGQWLCPSVACPICNLGDASVDAPSGDASATCTGSAPLCFGGDVTRCCGNDPAGSATCRAGHWLCGTAPAPGCNGQSCLQAPDAGSD
jgi:hypothetical protein